MDYVDIEKKLEDMQSKIMNEIDIRLSKILAPNDLDNDNGSYFEGKKVRNCFHSEFNQYRTELANTISNTNEFEQKVIDSFNMINSELVQVNKEISVIKGSIDILFNKVKESEDKLFQIDSASASSTSSISSVNDSIGQVRNIINRLSSDIQANGLIINNQTKSIESIRSELSEQIKALDKALNYKMKSTAESVYDIVGNFNKEIDHFESHILTEQSSFINLAKSTNEEHINKLRSIVSYLTSDVDLLRNKCDYNDNSIHKLRSDVFNSLQLTEEFVLNKKIKYSE